MKQKIYKVLGIVLTMAIIMSTCVCAVWNVSAEGTGIVFAQGTIDNGEVKPGSPDRVHTPDALAKADYESVTVAAGWKAYFHFYDANDSYLGKAGNWATGPVTVNTASMRSDAVYFRVVIGEANNAAITPETVPADAVTFKETPKLNPTAALFTLGNVKTGEGKFVINGAVDTRATNKELLALADYDEVTMADGWKAWFYAYKSDGETLSNTTGSGDWKTGTYSLRALAGLPDATYFSITIANDSIGTLVIEDIPEDTVVFKEAEKDVTVDGVTTPVMIQGNILSKKQGEIQTNSTNRIYTKTQFKVEEYEKVVIADGYRMVVHFWDADGAYIGESTWQTGTKTLKSLPNGANATYFRVVAGPDPDLAEFAPADFPAGTLTLVQFPEDYEPPVTEDVIKDGILYPYMASGTVNGAPNTLDTCVGASPMRLYTVTTFAPSEIDEIMVASGCRAFVQFFKADKTYSGGSGWIIGPATSKIASLGGYVEDGFFKVTFANPDDTAVPPADGLTFKIKEKTPEDVIVDGILYPGMMKGTCNGVNLTNGTLINSTQDKGLVRLATYNTYKVADIQKIIVAEDCRAFVQFFKADEDGTYNGGVGWLNPGTYTVGSMIPKINDVAQTIDDTTLFKVTLSSTKGGNDTQVPDAKGLAFIPMPEEVPCEHTYDNDCDKDCNLCGELREVADHVYDNACDKDCNVCGETREVADHVYENYTSNNDATCTANGTETGTCKCGATDTREDADSKLDHTYENYTSNGDATCTANGTETGTCKCGATDTREDADSKLDHTYENYTSNGDATCTANGTETGTCKCGATDTREDADSKLDHTYENYTSNGDATCTANGTETGTCKCGATDTREDADSKLPHTYDDEYDAECNECGHIRDAACKHEYDNDCDADCNLCGEIRVVADHVYENYTSNNDATCAANGTETGTCACGATDTREVADSKLDHTYDNACDADCNECGATREVADHVYDNACDANCNVCGATREVADHVYDNACDTDCNVCGAIREVGDHVYDNACDADCNNCGETREVADHVYDNACDADCNECGEAREVADHVYDNACDKDCNVCGAIREVADHVYDNACDTDCNVCGATREVGDHVYDDIFDAECNECGNIREVPDKCDHEYDNLCDAECNLCFELREVGDHKYNTEYDVDCNNCGFIREAEGFDVVEIKEVDGKEYIFVDGRTAIKGLFKIGGDYYFSNWGGEIVRDQKAYVKISYCDLPGGKEYTFGADGKLLNGFVEKDGVKYLYFNGITATKGIFKIDGDYYFSDWGGVVKGGTFYTSYIFTEDLTPGEYTFDEEGKMVDGFVEKDGETVLYKTGKVADPGLHEVDGKYYIVTWNGVIRTNGTYFVKESFCDKEANRNLEVGLDGVVTNI